MNGELEERTYKRVAIVEDFFDIIYNVHVEMDGRGGKHAGQKRTYRAVSNILEKEGAIHTRVMSLGVPVAASADFCSKIPK